MQGKLVVLEPNHDNFAEFGTVISKQGKNHDQQTDTHSWWAGLGRFESPVDVNFNILSIRKRKLELDKLEYHLQSKEVIIPMGAGELLVPVAPCGELDEGRIKVFRIDNTKALVLNAGVYHFLPFPVNGDGDCIIAFKKDTENSDLTFFPLSRRYEIQLDEGR